MPGTAPNPYGGWGYYRCTPQKNFSSHIIVIGEIWLPSLSPVLWFRYCICDNPMMLPINGWTSNFLTYLILWESSSIFDSNECSLKEFLKILILCTNTRKCRKGRHQFEPCNDLCKIYWRSLKQYHSKLSQQVVWPFPTISAPSNFMLPYPS